MRRVSRLSTLAAVAAVSLAAAEAARATNLYWVGDFNSDFNGKNGTDTNWSTDTAGTVNSTAVPTTNDDVFFSSDAAATFNHFSLAGTTAINAKGLFFTGSQAVTIASSAAGTLGADGISIASGAGQVTLAITSREAWSGTTPVTWYNNSSNAMILATTNLGNQNSGKVTLASGEFRATGGALQIFAGIQSGATLSATAAVISGTVISMEGGTFTWSTNGINVAGLEGSTGTITGSGALSIYGYGTTPTTHDFLMSLPSTVNGVLVRGVTTVTQIFSAKQNYQGDTSIAQNLKTATLQIRGANDILPTGYNLTFGIGTLTNTAATVGKLVMGDTNSGMNQTVAGLSSQNLATAGSGSGFNITGGGSTTISTLSVVGANNGTYYGVIGGTGTNENLVALVKGGTSVLTLAGVNTYTGGTTINGGVLIGAKTTSLVNYATQFKVNSGGYVGGQANTDGVNGWNSTQLDDLMNSISFPDNTAGFAIDTTQGNFTYGTNITKAIGFAKTGSNTLLLTGTNSYTGGTTIYNQTAGNVTLSSTLQVGSASALGSTSGQLTVNGGLATQPNVTGILDLNGFSVGVGNLNGNSTGRILNNSTGTSVTLTIGNGNATGGTFSGIIANSSSGTGTVALTKTGSGTITLAGNNTYTGATAINQGKLVVNGSMASALQIASNATLGGSGSTSQSISGAGIVSPGSSAGIFTASSLNPTAGTHFAFEFTQTGSPTYNAPTASGNDILHLTGATPISSAMTAANEVDVYFNLASLSDGQAFKGGFYADSGSGLSAALAGATFDYFVKGDGNGTHAFNGVNYYTLAEFNNAALVNLSTLAEAADFGGGAVSGQVADFTVSAPVPEPGVVALGSLVLGGLALRRRRRVS